MTTYTIRVRRGDREVEVQGPTEEFVRGLLNELIEEHFAASGTALVPTAGQGDRMTVPTSSNGHGSHERTLRELLNDAPNASASEKVVLAAYLLKQEGQDTFGREDVDRLFDEAMERRINFPREVKAAILRGWVAKVPGATFRYRLIHSGSIRVAELTGATEGV